GAEGVGEGDDGVVEQGVLVREVPVQGGAGDADGSGDLVDAHAVVAAFAERLGRDRGDLCLAVLRPAPHGGGRGAGLRGCACPDLRLFGHPASSSWILFPAAMSRRMFVGLKGNSRTPCRETLLSGKNRQNCRTERIDKPAPRTQS